MTLKKGLITLCVIILTCSGLMAKHLRGDKNIINTERELPRFESISNNSTANITYTQSDEYKVIITIDSNLEKEVLTEVKKGVLTFSLKGENKMFSNRSYTYTKFEIQVFSPKLEGITINGAGNFTTNDPIKTTEFKAIIRGAGDIRLNGEADEIKISISGTGSVIAQDFITKNTKVNITGSGTARINATEYLSVHITGVGDVRYTGTPSIITKRIIGAGSVIRENRQTAQVTLSELTPQSDEIEPTFEAPAPQPIVPTPEPQTTVSVPKKSTKRVKTQNVFLGVVNGNLAKTKMSDTKYSDANGFKIGIETGEAIVVQFDGMSRFDDYRVKSVWSYTQQNYQFQPISMQDDINPTSKDMITRNYLECTNRFNIKPKILSEDLDAHVGFSLLWQLSSSNNQKANHTWINDIPLLVGVSLKGFTYEYSHGTYPQNLANGHRSKTNTHSFILSTRF